MLFTFVLHTGETPLARFDPSMINDQSRMEMLVTPIEDDIVNLQGDVTLRFTIDGVQFLDVQKWLGVKCNENGNVISIDWSFKDWACGKVSFDILPQCLISFNANKGRLSSCVVRGTISTELLPRSLETFIINRHAIGGSLELTRLPPAMKTFEAFCNNFEGTINLEGLPKTMEVIDLSENCLQGTICLTMLPASMRFLSLNENNLSGEISLDKLPEGMAMLELQENNLCGSPSRERIPQSLWRISLEGNYFEGEAFKNQKVR